MPERQSDGTDGASRPAAATAAGRTGSRMPAGAGPSGGAPRVPAASWWVLVAVGVGTFMSALDGSIVNTILPVLTGAFHADVAAVEWIVTVYLLVVSGLLLSVGRWGDLHGHKKTYTTGFGLFIVGSALCGLSRSTPMLVGFRALQALGAAALFATSPAILTRNFPRERRGQALGLQAMMTYMGLTVGPLLGGWLATNVSWRAVFYINVPVGLMALFLSLRFIPRDAAAGEERPFDVAGAAAFMVGLVALLTALNQGHAWGWRSAPVMGLLLCSVVVLVGFVLWEQRVPHPMLDLGLFHRWSFSAATASALMNYVSLFSIVFVLPFYLIQGRGLSPEHAGVVLSVQPVVMAFAAPLSGMASDRIGTRLPGTLGMAILTVGLFLLSRLGAHTPISHAAVALAVAGLGTGIFISPNNSALMGSAPRDKQGIASGVLATARNVGMVLGIGMAGAIITSVLARHGITGASASTGPALYAAVRAAFLAASAVAALGALTSAARGR